MTTGAERAILAIETNKPDAIEALRSYVGEPISVRAVETKYPHGAEKILIRSLLGREVPSGGLPVDVHVVVQNVATVAEIGRLLPHGRGLLERVVTLTGPAIEKKGNYRIPIGTPLRWALEQVECIKGLMGNYMAWS